jgi:hypothetical protein
MMRKSLAVDDGPAVRVQRIWRGVRARRRFSDMFFAAVETALGPEPGLDPSPSLYEEDDNELGAPHTPAQQHEPSLEEAQQEASYNPSATNFMHVPSRNHQQQQPPSAHRRTPSGTPVLKLMGSGAHRRTPSGATSACSTPLLGSGRYASCGTFTASPAVGGAVGGLQQPVSAGGVGAVRHLRMPSGGGGCGGAGGAGNGDLGVGGACTAAGSVANGSCGAPIHRRTGTGEGVRGASALAAAATAEEDEGVSGDLEFSEEMAESMSIDALRELAGMLTRVITTRNKELSALEHRRSELRQERDVRQATVTALVTQVDRSQFVKEERKRSKQVSRR